MAEEHDEPTSEDRTDVTDEALRPLDEAVQATLTTMQHEFLRFLARRLGSREDAEDALQEVWLKVVRGKAALDKKVNIEAWLRRVLRNALVDQYRRQAAKHRFEDALRRERELVASDPDVELEAVICACLYRLLPTLKPEYAELLWRVDLAGQPRAAVAHQLALTPNNFAVRLHRARQALRKRLEQTCESCPTHGFLSCACPRRAAEPGMGGRTVRPSRSARFKADSHIEASLEADAPLEKQHDASHRLP